MRPQIMPTATPTMSAIQSFKSALRLKLGWISSIMPPKMLAPKNTGSNPKRPVLDSGKERMAKATRCKSLSLPSGAGGGCFRGHSMATMRMAVTIIVIEMSRCFRILRMLLVIEIKCNKWLKKERIFGKIENGALSTDYGF